MPWKKILRSKIILALLVLLLIFGLNVEWKQWKERTSIQNEINSLTDQQNQIEQKNKTLEQSLQILKTKDYKDRIAKEQLNMKKDGEVVVNFPESLPTVATASNNSNVATTSNWELWWDYFFNNIN